MGAVDLGGRPLGSTPRSPRHEGGNTHLSKNTLTQNGCGLLLLFRTRAFNRMSMSTTWEHLLCTHAPSHLGVKTPGDSGTPRALEHSQLCAPRWLVNGHLPETPGTSAKKRKSDTYTSCANSAGRPRIDLRIRVHHPPLHRKITVELFQKTSVDSRMNRRERLPVAHRSNVQDFQERLAPTRRKYGNSFKSLRRPRMHTDDPCRCTPPQLLAAA